MNLISKELYAEESQTKTTGMSNLTWFSTILRVAFNQMEKTNSILHTYTYSGINNVVYSIQNYRKLPLNTNINKLVVYVFVHTYIIPIYVNTF